MGAEEKALDAMQDTFVQVLRFQEKLTDTAPSSLLYRIATNVCLNKMRSLRRHPETHSEELLLQIASAEDHESRLMDRLTLDGIFQRERPSTRAMAAMRYVDGMTLEEVATEVGLSVSGVRKRLRTLRGRVRSLPEEVA